MRSNVFVLSITFSFVEISEEKVDGERGITSL